MPTLKQQLVFKGLSDNVRNHTGVPLGQVLLQAGYSITASEKPGRVIAAKGFQELLDEALPDSELMQVHKQLLGTKRIDHMVFPLSIEDTDITELVESVGGTLRKVIHGETAKHAYWWVPNDKARHDALKLAYDLKGKLGKQDTPPPSSIYNTFIQNNTIDPNAPAAKELASKTLEILMQQTKRKVVTDGQTVNG